MAVHFICALAVHFIFPPQSTHSLPCAPRDYIGKLKDPADRATAPHVLLAKCQKCPLNGLGRRGNMAAEGRMSTAGYSGAALPTGHNNIVKRVSRPARNSGQYVELCKA